MPLDRTWYNTLVDDDGSNLVGTSWNKAAVDALMDAIDAAIDPADLTWTIVANTNLTLSATNVGRYVKIGRYVYVWGYVAVASVSGANAVTLTLPVTSAARPSNSQADPIFVMQTFGADVGSIGVVGRLPPSTTVMNLEKILDNAPSTALLNSDLTAGDEIAFSGGYFAAT